MKCVSEDEKFRRYILKYIRINIRTGKDLLFLSGGRGFASRNLDDGYWDGKRAKRVQGWIDKHDGRIGVVIFWRVSERHGPNGIKSDKSLLFIPDRGVSNTMFLFFAVAIGPYKRYTIDYYLKEIHGLEGIA